MTKNIRASSKVGLLFWLVVVSSNIPFTLLFLHLVADNPSSLEWWKWPLAVIIGLLPALLLGLIIQTIWDLVEATLKGFVKLTDYLFMTCLLGVSLCFGWFLWCIPEPWGNNMSMAVLEVVLFPLIGFYFRKRQIKQPEREN